MSELYQLLAVIYGSLAAAERWVSKRQLAAGEVGSEVKALESWFDHQLPSGQVRRATPGPPESLW